MAEKKIGTAEAVLLMLFVIFVDILEFLLTLVLVGAVVNTLINVPVALIIQFWRTMKGINWVVPTVGSLIEFIPVINALPIRTATMIMTIVIANNPKIVGAVGVAKGISHIKDRLTKSDTERFSKLKKDKEERSKRSEDYKKAGMPSLAKPDLVPAPAGASAGSQTQAGKSSPESFSEGVRGQEKQTPALNQTNPVSN